MPYKDKEEKREYDRKHKEEKREYDRKYQQEHKEEKREYNKKYYQENKEEWKENNKKYYQEHKKERKEYNRKWREENKEQQKEYKRKYYQENKEEINENRKKWEKLKSQTDPKYRLNCIISNAIWYSLKGKKAGSHWEMLVGYTLEDLMTHLKSQFESWMSWDNYGVYEEGKKKWHIDHIIPKSHFSYKTPEDPEFKECWKLENLQPLEAMKNMRKNNKLM